MKPDSETDSSPSNTPQKRKPLSKYLAEFLVIFIAVLVGFFADNYRESLSDRAKELNYVTNRVRDLKKEKTDGLGVIKHNEKIITALDTFIKLHGRDFTIKYNADLFLKLFNNSNVWDVGTHKPNETTLNQIKSTGGFNVIRPKIADLIAELDMSVQHVKWLEKFPYTHSEETFRIFYELTDYQELWDENPAMPELMTDDKKKLMKFFNLSADVMWTLQGYIGELKNHLATVDKVIETLEEEYELKK